MFIFFKCGRNCETLLSSVESFRYKTGARKIILGLKG